MTCPSHVYVQDVTGPAGRSAVAAVAAVRVAPGFTAAWVGVEAQRPRRAWLQVGLVEEDGRLYLYVERRGGVPVLAREPALVGRRYGVAVRRVGPVWEAFVDGRRFGPSSALQAAWATRTLEAVLTCSRPPYLLTP